jgi:hypothetical protein
MRLNHLFLRLIVVAVLLAACTPAETQTTPPQPASATPAITVPTETPVIDLRVTRAESESLNSATPAPTIQAIATSRGPNLEATDPQTVSTASGGLQFVEFFEFW